MPSDWDTTEHITYETVTQGRKKKHLSLNAKSCLKSFNPNLNKSKKEKPKTDRTCSISKCFTRNSTLPPKIPVFEQNQKRNEDLLLCFGFPIGHAEYLITASHEFLFGFLPELLWLILAQEQISACSQWTLLFCPDLAGAAILLKGLQVLRRDISARMYAHMSGQYTHLSPEVLPSCFCYGNSLLEKRVNKPQIFFWSVVQEMLCGYSGCKRISGVTLEISSTFIFVSTNIHRSQWNISMEF